MLKNTLKVTQLTFLVFDLTAIIKSNLPSHVQDCFFSFKKKLLYKTQRETVNVYNQRAGISAK